MIFIRSFISFVLGLLSNLSGEEGLLRRPTVAKLVVANRPLVFGSRRRRLYERGDVTRRRRRRRSSSTRGEPRAEVLLSLSIE
jgi:hypothetical protein